MSASIDTAQAPNNECADDTVNQNASIPYDITSTVSHHESSLQPSINTVTAEESHQQHEAQRESTTQQPPDESGSAKSDAWRRFADWLHCVCVVTFDLELGQAMELVYPAHARLSEAERTNVCYLAFPDSNSGCMGDTQFHIRLRVQPERPADGRLGQRHRRYNERCEARVRADEGHLWGFVYFRQIRDIRRPRGYFQKVSAIEKGYMMVY